MGIRLGGEAPDPTNADLRWKALIGSGAPLTAYGNAIEAARAYKAVPMRTFG